MRDITSAFIQAAIWHGDLTRANEILAAHPEMATLSIHAAAVLGDDAAIHNFIEEHPANATATGGPWGTQPLVYLGLSKYLRLDPTRSDGFVRAARMLLDAGADPNAGFWSDGEFETALYGAAGVAHHPDLTQLLLERGANPNDEEVAYHSPETYDNRALKLIVQTGRVTPEKLALMVVRKHDWHDYEGVKWLLEHGADLNYDAHGAWHPLHHAIRRDNHIEMIELLLHHGADPLSNVNGASAVILAARHGRADVLASFERRGVDVDLQGVERLLAACAAGDAREAEVVRALDPAAAQVVFDNPGEVLARFAGVGNVPGVRALLDLGVDIGARFSGDGYWGIAPESTVLHVAAWRARHEVVQLLIERGASIDSKDGEDRTPLALAVKACVDSYWSEYRSPQSVEALLRAGASTAGIEIPTGYEAIDEMLSLARVKELAS